MTDGEARRQYKIGEVCRMAGVQPYVLRYWETEFSQLAPSKSGGGQRVYTQQELDIILRIKQLLYSEGFTIAGAKKKLDAEDHPAPVPEPVVATPAPKAAKNGSPAKPDKRLQSALADVKRELGDILGLLEEQ